MKKTSITTPSYLRTRTFLMSSILGQLLLVFCFGNHLFTPRIWVLRPSYVVPLSAPVYQHRHSPLSLPSSLYCKFLHYLSLHPQECKCLWAKLGGLTSVPGTGFIDATGWEVTPFPLCPPFLYVQFNGFNVFTELYNHHHNQFYNIFSPKKEIPNSLVVTSHFPSTHTPPHTHDF